MTILKEVIAELIGMFLGDAWLAVAVILVVALAAALIELAGIEPLAGGAALLLGCLTLLVESVRRRSRAAGIK